MALRPRAKTLQVAFGLALRQCREAQDLSQEELGFRAEVHRTYISELERGLKSPSLGTLERLAVALEIRTSKLIEGAEALLK
tara:strand:+ start:148 stop:393 length:246 start_codon:yes stop_codon:yes gene_type:complete